MVFRKKLIVIILVASLLESSLAFKTQATDWFAAFRFTADSIAKAAAQGAFKALTNRILRKIQTGGLNGGALFVRDWRDFQLQGQYRGEDIWRGILYFAANGDGSIPPLICDYIKNSSAFKSLQPREIKNAGILALSRRVDSLQEFITASKCNSSVNEKYDIFIKNFNQGGGWDTWGKLLQPQNNIYGIIEMASDELVKQRKIEESATINEARAGSGYTAIRDCLTQTQGTSTCSILGKIKTPGSTLGQQVASIFDTNLKFYTTADAASLAIAVLTEFATNKLFDGLADADTNDNGSAINFDSSYKTEFCSADDNMSWVAANYVLINYPAAAAAFPPEEGFDDDRDHDVGKSYCKNNFNIDDNRSPYMRCVQACEKAVGLIGNDISVPPFIDIPVPPGGGSGGGLTCAEVPTALACSAPNHTDIVANVKNYVVSQGISISGVCGAFEITKRVAWALRGEGTGLMATNHSGNCNGLAAGLISYTDGSEVDILGDEGGANSPQWLPGPDNPEPAVFPVPASDPGDPPGSY